MTFGGPCCHFKNIKYTRARRFRQQISNIFSPDGPRENVFSGPYNYISQGSVETHLPCGEIYNNHIIANCMQSVPRKEI